MRPAASGANDARVTALFRGWLRCSLRFFWGFFFFLVVFLFVPFSFSVVFQAWSFGSFLVAATNKESFKTVSLE